MAMCTSLVVFLHVKSYRRSSLASYSRSVHSTTLYIHIILSSGHHGNNEYNHTILLFGNSFHLIFLRYQLRTPLRRTQFNLSTPLTKQKCIQSFLLMSSYWTGSNKKNNFGMQCQRRLKKIG